MNHSHVLIFKIFNVTFIYIPCSISPNIREGLLETFYGVYEKDPDKVFIFYFF